MWLTQEFLYLLSDPSKPTPLQHEDISSETTSSIGHFVLHLWSWHLLVWQSGHAPCIQRQHWAAVGGWILQDLTRLLQGWWHPALTAHQMWEELFPNFPWTAFKATAGSHKLLRKLSFLPTKKISPFRRRHMLSDWNTTSRCCSHPDSSMFWILTRNTSPFHLLLERWHPASFWILISQETQTPLYDAELNG